MSGEGAFVSLTKGPVHTAIEVCVNDPADYYAKRRALYLALKDLQPPHQEHISDFLFIIRDIAGVTGRAARYLETHWFEQWWPEKKFKEPILRLGIIRAIEVANSNPEKILPINFLWLNIGKRPVPPVPSEVPYATYVILTQQEVHCLLVTPRTESDPSPAYIAALVSDDHYWIVKDSNDSDPSPGDPSPGEELYAEHGDGLRTMRLKVLDPKHPLQTQVVSNENEVRASDDREGAPG